MPRTWIWVIALAALAVGPHGGLADCVPTPGEEDCERSLNDGIDNDCNGLTDSQDPGCSGPPETWVRRGDCNSDGRFDISDPICLLGYLFLGDPASLPCHGVSPEDNANVRQLDTNRDGQIDLSDAVHMLSFLFSGGPPSAWDPSCVVDSSCPGICVLDLP